VDSMQIYRGLDVGTEKPTRAMRARVAHHLVDAWEPGHDLSVAEYQARARAAIEDIRTRGRSPLLVGGSGLYFRAVVDDLRFPPRSEELRRALEAEVDSHGPEALHARLRKLDPLAARRIGSTNARRIVRALEVIALTGRPFSDSGAWERYASLYDLRVAGLALPRTVLYERIAARVEEMMGRGLAEEARALARGGLSSTARQALGYRQVLDAPEARDEDLRASILSATKRFARRQESWFRTDPRIRWFDGRSEGLVEDLVAFFTA
jgi:tRNA dimethylallyltransferase